MSESTWALLGMATFIVATFVFLHLKVNGKLRFFGKRKKTNAKLER